MKPIVTSMVKVDQVESQNKINCKMNSSKIVFTLFGIFVAILFIGVFTCGEIVIGRSHNQVLPGEIDCDYNDRPIIGILAQEYYAGTKPPTPANNSYIAASYVKFVEGAGARAVPIFINKPLAYYDKIFQSINGILFPGGSVDFDTSGFGTAGKYLYKLAKLANDNGDYFPLWGTCMGFEFLIYAAVGNHDVLVDCDGQNITNNLRFTKDALNSKLFGPAPKSIIKLLETQNLTANFHHRCVTNEVVKSYSLEQQIRILSWNFDKSGQIKYVSSFEFTKHPFFGVQFHPEKNIYEWSRKESLPHSLEGIQVAQYFANVLVQNARKNHHKFESDKEENTNLIYNFNPVFTGSNGSMFAQSYIFPLF